MSGRLTCYFANNAGHDVLVHEVDTPPEGTTLVDHVRAVVENLSFGGTTLSREDLHSFTIGDNPTSHPILAV